MKPTFYEQLGIIIPGSILMFGLVLYYPELKLLTTKGKVTKVTSWPITLDNGKTWDKKIAYTAFMGAPTVTANLYLLPDTTTVYRHANNGESTK